jgi:hypothetical protein
MPIEASRTHMPFKLANVITIAYDLSTSEAYEGTHPAAVDTIIVETILEVLGIEESSGLVKKLLEIKPWERNSDGRYVVSEVPYIPRAQLQGHRLLHSVWYLEEENENQGELDETEVEESSDGEEAEQ